MFNIQEKLKKSESFCVQSQTLEYLEVPYLDRKYLKAN